VVDDRALLERGRVGNYASGVSGIGCYFICSREEDGELRGTHEGDFKRAVGQGRGGERPQRLRSTFINQDRQLLRQSVGKNLARRGELRRFVA